MTEVCTVFTLQVLNDDGSAPEQRFDSARIGLGRSPDNECCCAAPTDRIVSHRHCEVRQVGGRFQLNDCASLNGTFLNGRRTDNATLMDGDIISLGQGGPRLRFRVQDGAPHEVTCAEGRTTTTAGETPKRAQRQRWLLLLLGIGLLGALVLLFFQQKRIDGFQVTRFEGVAASHARGLATLVLAQPSSGGTWLHLELAPALIADHDLVLVASIALSDARRRLALGGGRLLIAPNGQLSQALAVKGLLGDASASAALLRTETGLPLTDPPRFSSGAEPASLFWRLGQAPQVAPRGLEARDDGLQTRDGDWCWGLLLAADGIAGLGAGPAASTHFVSGVGLGSELARSRTAPLHSLP